MAFSARTLFLFFLLSLSILLINGDGGHDMGHGGHDMGHGGHDGHAMGPADLHEVGEQIHLVECKHLAADNASYYNLFPIAGYEDYTAHFKPYDRSMYINICRDTVRPCDRNGKREVESHPICLVRDDGDVSLGQTSHSHGEGHQHVEITDSPLGPDRGVVLVYEGGDVCQSDPTKKYQSKVNLVCDDTRIDELLECEDADWAKGDTCTLAVTCYSRCACPNKPDCKNPLLRYGSDWNDWGHGWLGSLLVVEGILLILLDFGLLQGTKNINLQKYPKLLYIWNAITKFEDDKKTSTVTWRVDIEMLESIGLIVAGSMFDILTLKCCTITHPPGSMHFLVGLCLIFLGSYGVVFKLSKRLNSKAWNFVMPTTLSFIGMMLIQHEQGGAYMTMMHWYLACALLTAAFFRAVSAFNKKFNLLASISLMMAGSLLPGSSKSVVRYLEVKDIMPMTALFGLFMVILMISFFLILCLLCTQRNNKYSSVNDDDEPEVRKV